MSDVPAPDLTAPRRALVLGSGGLTGVGWEIGVLLGLADEGIDLTRPDAVIGTSAGAVVGAHLGSDGGLASAVETLTALPDARVPLSWRPLARLVVPRVLPGSPQRVGAVMGRLARRTAGDPTPQRTLVRASVEGLTWPRGVDLRITTLDATSGERRILTRVDGIPLADAVAASAAVPMMWPPVALEGRQYVDAGTLSATHADLAAGFDRIVVVTPWNSVAQAGWSLWRELELVGDARRCAVVADLRAKRVMGLNAMSRTAALASLEAGRRQGRAHAATVADVWGG